MLTGCLFGIDEIVPDHHLEHPAPRRDKSKFGDVPLELRQKLSRQTDGSRPVASFDAVFNGHPHGV
jgi:hypothetical protein